MHLTPTQTRIMDVLKDGLIHPFDEVASCIDDELSHRCNVRVHISNLRKQLRPSGTDIAAHIKNRVTYYHLVRLLASPNDGRT